MSSTSKMMHNDLTRVSATVARPYFLLAGYPAHLEHAITLINDLVDDGSTN